MIAKRKRTADIAIWGRIPPPIGGMTVHVQRLIPYLFDAGITVQMYSVGRRTPEHPGVRQVSGNQIAWFVSLLFGKCEPVHYVFCSNPLARFAATSLAVLRGVCVVLRIGNKSLESSVRSKNYIERLLTRFAVRHASVIIGVNAEICTLAVGLGAKRVLHVPGFIPAVCHNRVLPTEVADFLDSGTGPVLLAAGQVYGVTEADVYGAYTLLELVAQLGSIRLVYYAYRFTESEDPQHRLAEEIRVRGLQKRYFLFRSATDLLPAMLRCDLMVRPVLSDGDSNSIREALSVGLPVVASDCVARPRGVVTFSSGDLTDLQRAVVSVLRDVDGFRRKLRVLPKKDNSRMIVELFQELLSRER